jgi:hypothetical protein
MAENFFEQYPFPIFAAQYDHGEKNIYSIFDAVHLFGSLLTLWFSVARWRIEAGWNKR